jgi:hypothetical protein
VPFTIPVWPFAAAATSVFYAFGNVNKRKNLGLSLIQIKNTPVFMFFSIKTLAYSKKSRTFASWLRNQKGYYKKKGLYYFHFRKSFQ